jgi:hypothetical protein
MCMNVYYSSFFLLLIYIVLGLCTTPHKNQGRVINHETNNDKLKNCEVKRVISDRQVKINIVQK